VKIKLHPSNKRISFPCKCGRTVDIAIADLTLTPKAYCACGRLTEFDRGGINDYRQLAGLVKLEK
jgi:hypothetical protein